MLTNEWQEPSLIGTNPLFAAAVLQDHLMTVAHDLERLQRLLDEAGEALSTHFCGAADLVSNVLRSDEGLAPDTKAQLSEVIQHISGATTALQFQDIATQLVAHTSQRLRNCVDQLARDAFGDDEDGEAMVEIAPLRPNPVTQDEMDAGSVELF